MAAAVALAPPACAQEPPPPPPDAAPHPVLADTVAWVALPQFPGTEVQRLVGSASESGPYLLRVRLAPGTRLPPHTHPDPRVTMVLSGTLFVGFGETADEDEVVEIPTGAFYVAPAGVPHYVRAERGAVTFQESGVGPSATVFSGPAGPG